jgi:hypothetical protein
MSGYAVFSVETEDREDGGLRVWSDDLPGLVLSGSDGAAVMAGVPKAATALLEHRGLLVAYVAEAQPKHYAVRYLNLRWPFASWVHQ